MAKKRAKTVNGHLEGFVDGIDSFSVVGWAWDHTDQSVDVELWVDGVLAGRCTAEEYRADLKAAGKGNGFHGFTLVRPLIEDGRRHTLRVVFAGTRVDLHGSPTSV